MTDVVAEALERVDLTEAEIANIQACCEHAKDWARPEWAIGPGEMDDFDDLSPATVLRLIADLRILIDAVRSGSSRDLAPQPVTVPETPRQAGGGCEWCGGSRKLLATNRDAWVDCEWCSAAPIPSPETSESGDDQSDTPWKRAADERPICDGWGERYLLTWCTRTATYDIGCIDGNWTAGETIDVGPAELWRWLDVNPERHLPPPPETTTQGSESSEEGGAG